MKYILASLMAAVAFAHADLVIEQKMESAFMNGNMTMKVKGDQTKVDMPAGQAGAVTMIIDSKSGTMDTYLHEQKMVVKRKISDTAKLAGVDPSKLEKPKPTGQKEKVGEWDTEIFEFDSAGTKGKVWVAKEFPNYKVITEQMNKMSAAMGGAGYDPSKYDLGGMVVKTEMSSGAGKITLTVLKVKEEAVPDSEFKAPEGYKDFKFPGQ